MLHRHPDKAVPNAGSGQSRAADGQPASRPILDDRLVGASSETSLESLIRVSRDSGFSDTSPRQSEVGARQLSPPHSYQYPRLVIIVISSGAAPCWDLWAAHMSPSACSQSAHVTSMQRLYVS